MGKLMSIGKVSKLKNVSIKSLRYYDQIGILKPAFVNTETNYRYYTEDQLYLLDAITMCIKLGIPLKDLNNYVENDAINLQKLLYDGKILAEEKIREIRDCFETLQETLQNMASPATGYAKIPESKVGIKVPDGFFHAKYPTRVLLMIPLDEMDVPKYYGQYILKLFVTAQQLGFTANYPSGVLHEYQGDQYSRYMFLTLAVDESNAENIQRSVAEGPLKDQCSVRIINQGDFACRKIAGHMSDQNAVKEEMKEVLKTTNCVIIETDTASEENKKNGYPFELEYAI